MILYASQRGRSAELAAHLLNGHMNEHVTVHEVRGFVAQDLAGALREAYAVSRGTRCKQFLFSLSLNPPEYADVPVEDFEAAIEAVERKMKLLDQPRIIVFHEKNGRRHCHCIWSRIDVERMVAVNLPHYKLKLMDISRGLFLKHGWKMPKGMLKKKDKSRLALTREEYRQAVRLSEDPEALKRMFRTLWERSDSREAFASALEERGFLLARGDRRGYVAIDIKGGIFSLTRWIDVGTRALKARLGKPAGLPSIEQAKGYLGQYMTENIRRYMLDVQTRARKRRAPLLGELREMVTHQREQRKELLEAQRLRWVEETSQRRKRFPTGMAGIWQRATGDYDKIRALNEAEAKAGLERDRRELHRLVRSHLEERQKLQETVKFYKEEETREAWRLRQEVAQYVKTSTEPQPPPQTKATEDIPTLTARLEQIETKLAMLTSDLGLLQASLEDNRLSDEMRARIRRVIEITMEKLQIKAIEEREQTETRQEQKAREYRQKQAEFNDYVRRYAETQQRIEREKVRLDAQYGFALTIRNMSYSLNGLPAWKVAVMPPPPDKWPDEPAIVKSLRKYNMDGLADIVLKSPSNASDPKDRPPLDPPMAVADHRENVLVVKEMLIRAGDLPRGGGKVKLVPELPVKATIKFNDVKI